MKTSNPAMREAKAKIFKALGHPTRLWIVEKLSGGECCVCEFVNCVEVDFSTISKHLSVLKQAGVIIDDKRGKQVFYRLKCPCIMEFIGCLEGIITDNIKEKNLELCGKGNK